MFKYFLDSSCLWLSIQEALKTLDIDLRVATRQTAGLPGWPRGYRTKTLSYLSKDILTSNNQITYIMSSPKPPGLDVKPIAWFEQKTIPKSTVPWYKHDIGPRLKPATRTLYRDYSGLNDDDIVEHPHSIVRLVALFMIQTDAA